MLFLEAILADVGLDGVAGDEALNEATEVNVQPDDGVAVDLLARSALKLVHGALDLVE